MDADKKELSGSIGVDRRLSAARMSFLRHPAIASTEARREFWKKWLNQIPRGADRAGRPQEVRVSTRHARAGVRSSAVSSDGNRTRMRVCLPHFRTRPSPDMKKSGW